MLQTRNQSLRAIQRYVHVDSSRCGIRWNSCSNSNNIYHRSGRSINHRSSGGCSRLGNCCRQRPVACESLSSIWNIPSSSNRSGWIRGSSFSLPRLLSVLQGTVEVLVVDLVIVGNVIMAVMPWHDILTVTRVGKMMVLIGVDVVVNRKMHTHFHRRGK